jgi:hypothetical protein
MFFDPRGGSISNQQTRGAFVYGVGFDVPMSKHFLVRAQYRGFVYKTPDFEMTSLKVDKYTSFRCALRWPGIYVLARSVSRLLLTLQGGCFSRLDT